MTKAAGRGFSTVLAALVLCAAAAAGAGDNDRLREEVYARERAFARTMADRDLDGFRSFIAPEAIFFNGPAALRGREAVVAAWAAFFDGADAPFSWDPDRVEVLVTGDLALSSGPVRDPEGNCIGRFNSIWRRTGDTWLVVFDKGSGDCPEPPPAAAPTE